MERKDDLSAGNEDGGQPIRLSPETDTLPSIGLIGGHLSAEAAAVVADTLHNTHLEAAFSVRKEDRDLFLAHLRLCDQCREEILAVLEIRSQAEADIDADGKSAAMPPEFADEVRRRLPAMP